MQTPTIFWCIFISVLWYPHPGLSDDDVSPRDWVTMSAKLRSKLFNQATYDNAVRPLERNNSATHVVVLTLEDGFYINYMGMDNGALEAAVRYNLIWNDSRLSWDREEYGGLGLLLVEPGEIWVPDLTPINILCEDVNISDTLRVRDSGSILWRMVIRGRVPCTAEMADFPYDMYDCTLRFVSLSYSDDEVLYRSRNIPLAKPIDIPTHSGWDVIKTSFAMDRFLKRTSLKLLVRLRRVGATYRYTLTLPAIAVVLMTLVICWIPSMSSRRVTLGGCNLLCLMLMLVRVASLLEASVDAPKIVIFLSTTMVVNVAVLVLSVLTLNMAAASVPCTKPPEALLHFLRRSTVGKVICLSSQIPRDPSSAGKEEETEEDEEMEQQEGRPPTPTEGLIKLHDCYLAGQALDRAMFFASFLVMSAMSTWVFC